MTVATSRSTQRRSNPRNTAASTGVKPSQASARTTGSHPVTSARKRSKGRPTGLFVLLFVSVMLLVMLGVVMGLSATAAISLSDTDSAWSLFRRHLMWACLGTVALIVTMRVDYHRWRNLSTPAIVIGLALIAATSAPLLSISANGANRWISIGPLIFQPSEPAKLGLVLFVADLLSRPSRSIEDNQATLRPVLTVTAVMVFLLMQQPHLGASLMITAIVGAMLWFAGTRLMPLFLLGLLAAAAVSTVVALSPWRMERMFGFITPWDDPLGNGYQPLQSLHALASGGIDGVGLGAGRAKWGFLPYAHTDFIFAVIGEELGLLGTMFVTVAFGVIGIVGFCVALRAPDRFGMLLAVGITSWIIVQAMINISTVVTVFPVVGMTLPLLSFGGSSLVTTMAGMGLLLNVARHTR